MVRRIPGPWIVPGYCLNFSGSRLPLDKRPGPVRPLDAGEDCLAGVVAELLGSTPISEPLAPPHYSLTSAIMRKRTVKLHGRHCEISVHREGKHVRTNRKQNQARNNGP